MKNKIFYIFISFCFISCQNEVKVLESELNLVDSLYYKNNSLFSGWAVELDSSGYTKSEKYIQRGIPNGYTRAYHKNGQISQEIKPIGEGGKKLILMYHENGHLSMRVLMRSNVVDENDFSMWDENGQKIETSFQEWILFLQSQGLDFGYIPSESDYENIRPEIGDSLLKNQ